MAFFSKLIKRCIALAIGICALLLVGLVGVVLRLGAGPIDVPMREALLARASASLSPGYQIEAGGAQLNLFEKNGVSGLRLTDVSVTDDQGREVVGAPHLGLRLALDPFDLENAQLREASIEGLALDIVRAEDGLFHIDAAEGAEGFDLAALMSGGGEQTDVPDLRLTNTNLGFFDKKTGARVVAEGAELVLTGGEDGLEARFEARITPSAGAPIPVNGRFTRRGSDGALDGSISFSNASPSRFASLDPALAELAGWSIPLSGEIAFRSDHALALTGDLHALKGGIVQLNGKAERIDAAKARFVYEGDRIKLDGLELSTPQLAASGSADLMKKDGGWHLDAALPDLFLRSDGNQIRMSGLSAQGDLPKGQAQPFAFETLSAETFELVSAKGEKIEGTDLTLSGGFDPVGQSLSLPMFSASRLSLKIGQGAPVRLGSVETALYARASGPLALRLKGLIAKELFLEANGNPVKAQAIGLDADYVASSNALTLSRLELAGLSAPIGDGKGLTAKTLSLSGAVNTAQRSFTADRLSGQDVVITLPDRFKQPLRIEHLNASASGRQRADGLAVRLEEARLGINQIPAALQGDFLLRNNQSFAANLSARLGPLEGAQIAAHWPERAAPGAKRWLVKNLKEGRVPELKLTSAIDTATKGTDSLIADFRFEGARVSISGDLPHLQGGAGIARATLKDFALELDEGYIDVPGEGAFNVAGSRFNIDKFKPKPAIGNIDLQVKGAVRSVLRFLDTKPLEFISRSPLDIASANARIEGRVEISLPLLKRMKMKDVRYAAKAELREFSFIEPNTALPFTGDLLRVEVEQEGISLWGDARIDGLAARVRYEQRFKKAAPGEPSARVTAQSYLTPEDFMRRGVDVSPYLSGVIATKVQADLLSGGTTRFWIDGDASNAELASGLFGWSKKAGAPVTIKAHGFRNRDGSGRVERVELGGVVEGFGALAMDQSGSLAQAQIGRLVLPGHLDAAIHYARGAGGSAKVEIEGAHADLRAAFAQAIDSRSASRPAPPRKGGLPTEVAVRVDVARLRDDLALYNLHGGLRLSGRDLEAAKVNASANGQGPFQLLAERRRDGYVLDVKSANAGALLEAASVFSGARGGQLHARARTRDVTLPSQIVGQIEVEGISVHESETLRDILTGGSVSSLVRRMTRRGLVLDRISLPFNGVGGRWEIRDGLAHGPAVGVTLTGAYDIGQKGMDLHGTVSPAYAINGALGNVPLVGELLTGGEGEGVFGVTFNVQGSTDRPDVRVNPLSAITPGFLRKIFSALVDPRPKLSER